MTRRRYLVLWQLLLIILGTTWIWAPHLNGSLSPRTSLISQYEMPFEAYSWLFRTGDLLAGGLVLLMAYGFYRRSENKNVTWLLLFIGAGLLIDPLLTTTCRVSGASCQEYLSAGFVLHAIETVVTSSALFLISVYDAWLRKKLLSVGFALFQIAYGLLFISQLANRQRFNTFSQFVYQTALIVWLAWFCRDFLMADNFLTRGGEVKLVKIAAAVWAFINGILAILISLAHIHLLGKIRGLYFAGDSAWLAQHGMIIGVVMLYLSRHLARGEMRARQIFLAIAGIETLKYSVISPNPGLMVLYLITFCALFIFRDDFNRGVIPLTWAIRLRDFYFMVAALLLAVLVSLLALDRDNKITIVASRSFDNFFDYVARSDIAAKSHVRSALLAHTISAFLLASIAVILWILFKPYKSLPNVDRDYQRVETTLARHSSSSEDFFKLWPPDKDYFWQNDRGGFVAYRLVGPIAFALADPISADKKKLLEEFTIWAKGRRLRACFLPVYENSLGLYEKAGLETIQIGSSAIISIQDFLTNTANDKWWRWKKNRAIKSGYVYDFSAPPHSAEFLRQLKTVSDSWLDMGGHKERGFALGYFDEGYLQKCRIHYLRSADDRVMAFTNQLPQFKDSPTVTVDLLRYLPDANDAMPYLLFKTIECVANENDTNKLFDLGFVPFAKAKGPLLTIAKALSGERFSARGLEQFKNKFNPDWQPNYMAYEGDIADLALSALHLEKAMDIET